MHYRTICSLSALTCGRTLILCVLVVLICGCREDKVRRHQIDQIRAVNAAIDKWNPTSGRKPQDAKPTPVKGTGFDFLNGQRIDEFSKFLSFGDVVSKENILGVTVIGNLEKWTSQHAPGTMYYVFCADRFHLGDGTETFDLLIIACLDEIVVESRFFAIVPY